MYQRGKKKYKNFLQVFPFEYDSGSPLATNTHSTELFGIFAWKPPSFLLCVNGY
jgi:hypothetical protein